MKVLLDTNVLSEMRKPRPHGGAAAWFRAQAPTAIAVPSIAIFELQLGTEILRRQDGVRAQAFDAWIEEIILSSTILPLDERAARVAAQFIDRRSSELLPDAMIASIAKVNGLTVATRNIHDFERFDVPLVDPFKYRG